MKELAPSRCRLQKPINNKATLQFTGQEKVSKFSPDRFISRQDLISWKAKLDYEVMPGLREEQTCPVLRYTFLLISFQAYYIIINY
ncbi:hypothetical protein ACET3Z_003120 [Daucus carota]